MQIKLSMFGPPMWFLGDPKNLTVNLNYMNPGPVELNFGSLSTDEQQKVLQSVQNGQLECDITYAQLYQEWATSGPAIEVPQDPQVEAIRQRISGMREQLETERKVRENKDQEKCSYLLSGSVRAMKAAITGMKDIKLVHRLLVEEKVGKKRKGVVTALEKKQHQLALAVQARVAKKINSATKLQNKTRIPGETIKFNVVESEQESVVLTPSDLIAAATEESAGGE